MNKLLYSLIVVSLLAVTAGAEETGHLRIEVITDVSSGDYGTRSDIEVVYLPVSAEYSKGRFVGKLTVPYLDVSYAQQTGARPGPGPRPTAQTLTYSGVGDIILSAGYRSIADYASGWYVTPKAIFKLGTANENNGFTTGENDLSLQVDAARESGEWTVFGHAGYTAAGDPPGVSINNTLYGRIGAQHGLGTLHDFGVYVDLRQAASAAFSRKAEATVYVLGPVDESTRYSVFLRKGFTSSVADWGAGFGLTYSVF